nr:MAG TPA_asm: hypothetical protein [Caudoviricetes sp.]
MSSSSSNPLQILQVGTKRFGVGVLQKMLTDIETALFFAKAYKMDVHQVSKMLQVLFKSPLTDALFDGYHSVDLQDYLVDLANDIPEYERMGRQVTVDPALIPKGEILPQVWESMELTVAKSIQDVADKLFDTLDRMPSKYGEMTFTHLRKFNSRRPTMAAYEASIVHKPQAENLVIFDVSGSMSVKTVETIVDDVVALSYKANAHLAIVSNDTFHWEPGTYNTEVVLDAAQHAGTHYETLIPLLQQNWGTVVSIADYDSSYYVKDAMRQKARTRIGKLLDVSLVNRPTFLAECLMQFADETEPMLIGNNRYPL